jgi:hypothetical protein
MTDIGAGGFLLQTHHLVRELGGTRRQGVFFGARLGPRRRGGTFARAEEEHDGDDDQT